MANKKKRRRTNLIDRKCSSEAVLLIILISIDAMYVNKVDVNVRKLDYVNKRARKYIKYNNNNNEEKRTQKPAAMLVCI